MGDNKKLSTATKLTQALRFLDERSGAIIPPIQATSTYARDDAYDVRKPYWYKRDGNETTAQAEAIIADLEGAEESLLFASTNSNLLLGSLFIISNKVFFKIGFNFSPLTLNSTK